MKDQMGITALNLLWLQAAIFMCWLTVWQPWSWSEVWPEGRAAGSSWTPSYPESAWAANKTTTKVYNRANGGHGSGWAWARLHELPVGGRGPEPGWSHSGKETPPLLDLEHMRSWRLNQLLHKPSIHRYLQESISLERTCTETLCLFKACTVRRSYGHRHTLQTLFSLTYDSMGFSI